MKHKLKNIFMPLLVAVFGAFLPTDSAHAVGAVYQVSAAVEISVDISVSDVTDIADSANLNATEEAIVIATINNARYFIATLTGTLQAAVVDHSSAAAATAAAVMECESNNADTMIEESVGARASALIMDLEIPRPDIFLDGEIVVTDVNVIMVTSEGCAVATDGIVENDEYVALASGGRGFAAPVIPDLSDTAAALAFLNIENAITVLAVSDTDPDFWRLETFFATGDSEVRTALAARNACTEVFGSGGVAGGGMCDIDDVTVVRGQVAVAVTPDPPDPVTVIVAGSGGTIVKDDDTAENLAYAGVGILAIGAAALYISGGDLGLFNFSPDYGYSLTESGYSANVGGRMDFRKDGWHLYHSAGQTNRNGEFGEFRFQSGGEYRADIWTAAFSESVRGETADYDLSLSANFGGGIWNVSPVYRLHSRFDEGESKTRNSLNLEGFVKYDRWTISPSAGFRWENADDFADNARFNINLVRKL